MQDQFDDFEVIYSEKDREKLVQQIKQVNQEIEELKTQQNNLNKDIQTQQVKILKIISTKLTYQEQNEFLRIKNASEKDNAPVQEKSLQRQPSNSDQIKKLEKQLQDLKSEFDELQVKFVEESSLYQTQIIEENKEIQVHSQQVQEQMQGFQSFEQVFQQQMENDNKIKNLSNQIKDLQHIINLKNSSIEISLQQVSNRITQQVQANFEQDKNCDVQGLRRGLWLDYIKKLQQKFNQMLNSSGLTLSFTNSKH